MSGALLALLLAGWPTQGSSFAVDAGGSTIRFQIVHKLHRVHGESKQMEGKAVARGDGTVLTMVRVPVATFRSGDANRDAHMLETLEAGRHPFVVFKGVARVDGDGPPRGPFTMEGEVELHGEKRPVAVPLTLEQLGDGSLRARGAFDVSLEAHRIERPSLLFVKIDDACRIEFDLLVRKSER